MDLETRLRSIIEQHHDYILSLSVDFDVSLTSFNLQLINQIYYVDSQDTYETSSKPFAKIVSIDIHVNEIHNILKNIKDNPNLSSFFNIILNGHDENSSEEIFNDSNTITAKENSKFIEKTHVTMTHYKEIKQKDLRNIYESLCGCKVTISIISLLWNNKIAAFEVIIPNKSNDGNEIPTCCNDFIHITIWHDTDTSAYESNNLPSLLKVGEANRYEFPSPINICGVISIWEEL